MKIVLLGAPGAGKGTQAEHISATLKIPAISTGNILRAAVKNGTPVGLKAREYIDKGQLVPDDVIIGIVSDRVSETDCKDGFVLDGMPRTVPQAQALENQGIAVDVALCIEADDAVIEARLTGRRVCESCNAVFHTEISPPKAEGICDTCGQELTCRQDDEPETVRKRLRVFHEETEPVKRFYESRGKLVCVHTQEKVADTKRLVLQALGIQA